MSDGILSRVERAADVAAQPPDVVAYDVEHLLPAEDAPALIFGPPASLKSWIAMHLADAIVSGNKFLDRYAVKRRQRALYVNIDAGAKTFRNRVRRFHSPRFEFVSILAGEFSENTRTLFAEFRDGFVVIDCLSAIYDPSRSKDPAFAMREFVDSMRAIYAEFGCGGVIIDHPHRPKERGEIGDYHGSVQKEAAFRTMWSIVPETADKSDGPRRTKILCRKLSEGQHFAPITVVVDFQGDHISLKADEGNPAASLDDSEARILTWAVLQSEPFSKNGATIGVTGGRATDKRKAFERLVARSELVPANVQRSGGGVYYMHRSRGSSASGTSLDEPKNLDLLPGNLGSSTSSPFVEGDEPSGTRSQTDRPDAPDRRPR